jgi:hypothetical protein
VQCGARSSHVRRASQACLVLVFGVGRGRRPLIAAFIGARPPPAQGPPPHLSWKPPTPTAPHFRSAIPMPRAHVPIARRSETSWCDSGAHWFPDVRPQCSRAGGSIWWGWPPAGSTRDPSARFWNAPPCAWRARLCDFLEARSRPRGAISLPRRPRTRCGVRRCRLFQCECRSRDAAGRDGVEQRANLLVHPIQPTPRPSA